MNVKTPHAEQIVQYLPGQPTKGGAREVAGNEPSPVAARRANAWIDIGSKQEIYKLMEDLAASGVAVLFVSSEMEEVLGMADRA
ncbi:MAG: hypothetical protein CM1200mP34_4410 [Verrucomicrobiales bacterium]|nr:MAG: hypothetical protein CM1200mP34_4410 [Verrucomicrobiales bacterium]